MNYTFNNNFEYPVYDSVISDRTIRNRKRGNKITSYARANAKTYKALNDYIMKMDCNSPAFMYAINLRAKLQNCASHTLVREHQSPKTYEFIGAHTCKHKLCHICNSERSRAVRRKYLSYFKKNEFVDRKTGEVLTKDDVDFMHLTLTVPHTAENGFRGKRWYSDFLMTEFNFMRKKKFWQKMVFAGEFGIEVTKNANGMHIHIHALLLVHKEKQNRNKLHREILKNWNRQTTCTTANRSVLTLEQKAAIAKSNPLLTTEDIDGLQPTGSTLISLENLFVFNKMKTAKNDRWDKDKGLWKHYVNHTDENELIKGVLECIKYHFEPMCMNTETGEYDFDLMCEILPAIQGKPLYRKFGNFHGVKELNIIESTDLEDIAETIAETANDEVLHPITNEPLGKSDYRYMVIAARNLYYNKEDHYKPCIKKFARKRYIEARSLSHAMVNMTFLSIENQVRIKTRSKDQLEVELYQLDENDDFTWNNNL